MRPGSMRRNLLSLAALYGACLLAAMGCPSTNDSGDGGHAAVAAEKQPAKQPVKTARAATSGAAVKKPAPKAGGEYGAKKPKIDPIQVNGRYFVDWPKPKLALVISGRQDGYLEPCGCAGLENQKGGIGRRHALFKDLAAKGWPLAAVDAGGAVRRFGKQAEIELAITSEALKTMGYGAAGFGPSELRLSADAVAAAVATADPKDALFVSANVNVLDLVPKVRIVEAGGLKLGITAVLGAEQQKQINNADIAFSPAEEALAAVVDELAECDHRILLAYASREETERLAARFPQFDIFVMTEGADEPPAQAVALAGGKTRLIEVGHKGMYAVVLGMYEAGKPLRYQRVALDSRYTATPEMQRLMVGYQDQLKTLGWDGLELRPAVHPRSKAGDDLSGQFAGAESCKKCHPTAYGIWSKTKHAHATETLTKLDPPRQFDPQCVSCHSTGWNVREYVPYAGGFTGLDTTPQLAGNQCENCHGPGAAHIAAEAGRSAAKRDAQRAAMRMTAGYAQEHLCIKCHDLDNSPNFATNIEEGFKNYWPKVEHKGKQ